MGSILERVQNLSADIVTAEPGDQDDLKKLVSMIELSEADIVESLPRLMPYVVEIKKSLAKLESANDLDAQEYLDQLGAIVSVLEREIVTEESQSEATTPPANAVPASPAPTAITSADEFDDSAMLFEFLSEQDENLEHMESAALEFEKTGGEVELSELKGRLHTLKGEVGVLGLNDVSTHCHDLEDRLNQTNGKIGTQVLFAAIDWMRQRFSALETGTEAPTTFDWNAEGDQEAPHDSTPEDVIEIAACFLESAPIVGDTEVAMEFIFEARDYLEDVDVQLLTLEKDASASESIDTIFRAFHTIKGVAAFLELTCLQQLAHQAETMLDAVRDGTIPMIGEPLAVTFEVNDALRQHIDDLEEALNSGSDLAPHAKLPPLITRIARVISRGADVELKPEPAAVISDSPAPEAPATTDSAEPNNATAEQSNPVKKPAAGAAKGSNAKKATKETIKVDAERLNLLVDMIGELVISEAMVSQSDELNLASKPRLAGLFSHMDKITRELQELAMSMRMVPIRSTFRRMARLARDVANRVEKKIDFVVVGEHTELDKTVVDAIGDPLVHLIRNAVDHGIESSAEERVAAGKDPEGRIELRAFHSGGSIYIEIEDNGGGLDPERILAKAQERNVVGPDEVLTEDEIFNLIFCPGFSTAAKVTEVSGRGVGLDVVKRHIESLRGTTKVTSRPGHGSIFSIRLPLTLAIIDGMVVRMGTERYILPTASIVRMIRPQADAQTKLFDRDTVLKVGDDLVPLIRVDQLFGLPDISQQSKRGSAVIVEHEERQYAFLVDELLGQQQVVIKPLGSSLAQVAGISGGAIMPDGRVGLILDIAALSKLPAESRDTSGMESPIEIGSR